MLVIFESILPIFLLVLAGVVLKRVSFIDKGLWAGLEQLSYYVLFPAYLFLTLAQADYSKIDIATVSSLYLVAIFTFAAGLMLSLPAMTARGVGTAQFTSIFQASTRWNGFVALAIAEHVAPANGLAMIAFIIGIMIIPVNVMNIGLLIWMGGGSRNWPNFILRLLRNPLVFASLAGIVWNMTGFELYQPLRTGLDLLARSALGLGLLIIGAGLVIDDVLKPRAITLLPVFLKLLLFPAILIGLAWAAGLDSATIQLVALAGSVPTAMNGYLLAKQLGGDAELYAAITTLQTAASFATIPLVLAFAALF